MSPQELSGLQVCNQRKSGEGERPPSFSFLSRHLAFIINNSSRLGSGIFSILCGQLWTVMALWKYCLKSQYNERVFTLKCHLAINYCFLCVQRAYPACMLSHSVVSDCDSMNYGLPSSSAHGIFKARILELVAISSSRGASQPQGVGTQVSCVSYTAGGFFTTAPEGMLQGSLTY